MAAAAHAPDTAPHIPVLLRPLLEAVTPVRGVWVDGTLGAGGYTRALLEAGAERVIGVDRDPLALEMAREWGAEYGARLDLVQDTFSNMDDHAQGVDGVVLDLGVSSMQLDRAERGFSFMQDGPLDMRMSQDGPSAADLVNEAPESDLADILYLYGEERASRRIARAITRAREESPIKTTFQLVEIVEKCLPRPKPGQAHPATRSFQALRIAVNDEFGELVAGLEAAGRALKPGGQLAVVTFHSIEDRMVKRFLQAKSGGGGRGSRHAPELQAIAPEFEVRNRKAIGPDDRELGENPRSRSAKLRIAIRTDAPATPADRKAIGMPLLKGDR
ncbi:16S rRNA (cytosine1402-N4)-methyltransferase [Roseovarius pacificus]|uniref:Ribosomal RNA small subunit methyltransferase H n=1 Tax=Roseovarius pacificus TaxID=337701 RepID=A0A1M6XX77_9RHOB|nr:16S rRNA (cytosine(1402)-N(4))-methyltransferase RsmH [Roseovarius pacificus]GGO51638.1 ribosomal RNA small subunit methyltransferase H [Roseovarius pacificus]SHL10463.1 16S rRNA (cytosine1402-N4)-methyltransferase [Roseovarius pacificus]